MALDKYRYHIYPDRIYVIDIDSKNKVEVKGSEIITLLGLESYFYVQDSQGTSQGTQEDS
jgi:hypothetical protein